jgi:methylenetetrahydrofolate reductase (NADPH)
VPAGEIERLEEAGGDAEALGLAYTVDVARRIRAIDGVAGIHVMGIGRDDLVRSVIEDAGLFPRPTAP